MLFEEPQNLFHINLRSAYLILLAITLYTDHEEDIL